MDTKECKCCEKEKSLSDYQKDKSRKDGLHPYCKPCKKGKTSAATRLAGSLRYQATHIKETKARNQDNYQSNKEEIIKQTSAYYYANREHILQHRKIRRTLPEVKALNCAHTNKRRISKTNATPPWFEESKVLEIYKEAQHLTSQDGIRREVDHIVPLQGKHVCGLHCFDNLQILTKDENLRKSNKFGE